MNITDVLKKHKLWLEGKEGGEGADLTGTDLRRAYLRRAYLTGADLDYSCLPLWCGGLKMHIDNRQAIQILYHLLSCVNSSQNVSAELKNLLLTEDLKALANTFHRVSKSGIIKEEE